MIRRTSVTLIAALSSLTLAIATAAAAPAAGSLEADLAALHKVKTQPVREALLGWTTDHRAVYRSLICDQDKGGGRGPWCELAVCVTAKPSATAAVPPAFAERDGDACTKLLALDLNSGDAPRKDVKDADVTKAAADALAKLGTIEPGKTVAPSAIRTRAAGGTLEVTRTGKAGTGSAVVLHYATKTEGDQRPQNVRGVKVTGASMSPDGKCVAVVGHFTIDSHYEAVATATPRTLAKVICDAAK